jgi:hypothetical protein
MKHYPKEYQDLMGLNRDPFLLRQVSSIDFELQEYGDMFRDFIMTSDRAVFMMYVKYAWLAAHFVFKGEPRVRRSSNGWGSDRAYSVYLKKEIGLSQLPLTQNQTCTAVSTYLNEFFPDFMEHDPFKEPEYYAYPYKNISLGHLVFVYQMNNRLEVLEEADNRGMNYTDFCNWITNWALCYNDEVGRTIYMPNRDPAKQPFLKNKERDKYSVVCTNKFEKKS